MMFVVTTGKRCLTILFRFLSFSPLELFNGLIRAKFRENFYAC